MAEETPLWTIVFDFRLQFIGEEYWRDYDRGYGDSIHSVVFPSRRGECKYERVAYNGPRR